MGSPDAGPVLRSGILTLRPEVEVGDDSLSTWRGPLSLADLPEVLRSAVSRLAGNGATLDELESLVMDADADPTTLARCYLLVKRLRESLMLRESLHHGDRALLSIESVVFDASFESVDVDAGRQLRISRFTYVSRSGGETVAQNPLAEFRAVLHTPEMAAMLQCLSAAVTLAEVSELCGLGPDVVGACAANLLAVGLLDVVDEDGLMREDRDPTLEMWEFHDLLFKSRSRSGTHDQPVGGVFPYAGKLDPWPAVKPASALADRPTVPLEKPDMEAADAADPSLTRALETRHSVRVHGDEPISRRQLAELLYRSARIRALYPVDPADPQTYETSSRPYPSGGGSYDLEIYLTVGRCEGLDPGIYHYDPEEHLLRLVNDDEGMVEAMLHVAWLSAAQTVVPQVLITLASRHQRLSWKYRSIAYSVSLKNAGVLYQTFYLVATAMGLAPCGLGSGDSRLFSAATGIDPLVESPVGDFMLGSVPEASTAAGEAADHQGS